MIQRFGTVVNQSRNSSENLPLFYLDRNFFQWKSAKYNKSEVTWYH